MRFGVFGTGFWARETHAAAIAAHPDAELVGVWGRNPEAARSVAEAFGARAYEDSEALIEAVDAISVALPPDVQVDIAVRAATAGKHVVLEKPLAFSTAAADRVVEAVQSSGVRSVVFHSARFRPEVTAWIAAVRGAGDWHGAAVTLLGSLVDSASPFELSPWRQEKGALWDVGPHALAMVLAALGPVGEIMAAPGRGDTVHLVLRHASEASSTLSLSLTVPAAAATSSWWLYGPRGISHMPDGPTTPVEAFGHAVTALLHGTPADADAPASDVHHGREIVRILETAEAALARD